MDNLLAVEDLFQVEMNVKEVKSSGHICSQCHAPITDAQKVTFYLACGHFFHSTCIKKCFARSCASCKMILGTTPYARVEVMTMNVAKLLLPMSSEARHNTCEGFRLGQEEIKNLSGRECFEKLNSEVFANMLPPLRNVYYKQRVIHHGQYMWNDDGSVDIFLRIGKCQGLCWLEQLCQISLEIYTENNNTNVNWNDILYLLTFFEDIHLYFGEEQ